MFTGWGRTRLTGTGWARTGLMCTGWGTTEQGQCVLGGVEQD